MTENFNGGFLEGETKSQSGADVPPGISTSTPKFL